MNALIFVLFCGLALGVVALLSSYQKAITGRGYGCLLGGFMAIGGLSLVMIPFVSIMAVIWPGWVIPQIKEDRWKDGLDASSAEAIRGKLRNSARELFAWVVVLHGLLLLYFVARILRGGE